MDLAVALSPPEAPPQPTPSTAIERVPVGWLIVVPDVRICGARRSRGVVESPRSADPLARRVET